MKDGKIISLEKVEGDVSGITEVKNISGVLNYDRMQSKAFYFQNGKWVDDHEIIYLPDPEIDLIFK
ncbi:MAG: hypothetical protein P9M11_01290 [Candidatus Tenebribacter burtonii]|nr:hypothetical protein [Candidatus Tenebribacter burtonii]